MTAITTEMKQNLTVISMMSEIISAAHLMRISRSLNGGSTVFQLFIFKDLSKRSMVTLAEISGMLILSLFVGIIIKNLLIS